ncbi:MAG: OmpA family protein [Nannocystaceae bacterium]|nr:OmpA family protein [Nannocystaceae bacterium]
MYATSHQIVWLITALAAPAVDATASSEESDVSVTGESTAGDGEGTLRDKREDQRWIRRWAPERNMVELGIFGGVAFPSSKLELFEPDLTLPDQGFKELRMLAPDIGGRVGFYPLRFFGLEVEGAVLPTATDADDESATVWAARGHLIAQIPRWSVTPFVLAGPSALAVSSERSAVGNDADLGFHFGAGVKIFVSRYVALRFDIRDTLTAKSGVGDGVGHTVELLGGLSVTLNRKKGKKPPGDRDRDGILDRDDACIDVPGVPENEGCPYGDRDQDGILDNDDACPDIPGVIEYEGCPIPDTDGDGILDPDDKCVDEPGVAAYEGCPIPDTDGDGLLDTEDKCVQEPETKNGYRDGDGCPDEIPEAVKQFTGVIEGIFFDTNKATIKSKSRAKLDNAVKVLAEFPKVRIEVSGHTDDRGRDTYNMELSARRADSVKQYFVDHGIAADRIETRGAGETMPRQSNGTKAGRAQNRRIEFKLLQQK